MKLITVENDKKGFLTTELTKVADKDISKAVKNLKKMEKVMLDNNGIGITANQCGLLDSMFVFTLNDGTIEYAINPEIKTKMGGIKSDYEGCLSYPDTTKKVRRYKVIQVEYHNGTEVVTPTLKGLEARIFQHEMAHTEGQCSVLG